MSKDKKIKGLVTYEELNKSHFKEKYFKRLDRIIKVNFSYEYKYEKLYEISTNKSKIITIETETKDICFKDRDILLDYMKNDYIKNTIKKIINSTIGYITSKNMVLECDIICKICLSMIDNYTLLCYTSEIYNIITLQLKIISKKNKIKYIFTDEEDNEYIIKIPIDIIQMNI